MAIPPKLIIIQKFLKTYRKVLIMMLTPILCSILLMAVDTPESRCAYGIMIMAVFWVTEVTPIAVTSLLPLIIFPVLGVLKAKEVCLQYMKDTNILLLGGLLIALSIERWNVHKRVALIVLLKVGTQPRRLMLGFMLVTAFISMWITNTATTAMMTPIMEAVLKQLDKQFEKSSPSTKDTNIDAVEEKTEEKQDIQEADLSGETLNLWLDENNKSNTQLLTKNKVLANKHCESEVTNVMKYNAVDEVVSISTEHTPEEKEKFENHQRLCKAMLLCICYSANIGGTGTLTGTAPQLVLSGQVEDVFPDGPQISFIYWFVYAFPQMVLFLVIGWLYLQTLFLGIRFKHLCFCFRGKLRNRTKGNEMYDVMKKQYEELGPISYAEKTVLICFTMLVLLWFFRDPKFIPGWGYAFKKGYISDGTSAMVIGFLLFQLPSQLPECLNFKKVPRKKLQSKTILEWKYVSEKFHWNVLFLLGAGFALAQACKDSGLSLYLSCQLSSLKTIPQAAIAFIVCTMLTFLTEITSNTATATILLPILASMGQSIGMNPYFLMIPATVCASFAFMLPVATPPNAIVFATGRLSVADMAKAGFGMNVIGIIIVTLCINTYGYAYYDLGTFHKWAKTNVVNGTNC